MMEPVEFKAPPAKEVSKPWATTGAVRRAPNIINTLDIIPESLEKRNYELAAKYEKIKETEVRWEEWNTEDAELILVAYGTSARVARSAVDIGRKQGLLVGLLRPISLYHFRKHP